MTTAAPWFLRLTNTAPTWAEISADFIASSSEGLLDGATLTEYLAATGAANRAQAVLDGITDPVSVRVYDGNGTLKGSGTMATPWATRSVGIITVAEVTAFLVSASGTPDANWFLRFESGTRWVRSPFGLAGSGAACTWSLPTWTAGQYGTIGTVTMGVPAGGTAPSLVGAATSLTFTQGTGGTYDFGAHGYDPDGGPLTYALIGTAYSGITLTTAGFLTVSSSATAALRDLVVRVTDNTGLSSDWHCAVTVTSASTAARKLYTNFAGLTLKYTNTVGDGQYYGYTPTTWPITFPATTGGTPTGGVDRCGDRPYFDGTDSTTGQFFDYTHPTLFTGSIYSYAQNFNQITGINSGVRPFVSPSQRWTRTFETLATPAERVGLPTGVTTAHKIVQNYAYLDPDQNAYQISPSGSDGKMIYQRMYYKLLSGWKAKGSTWAVLCQTKFFEGEGTRFQLGIVKWGTQYLFSVQLDSLGTWTVDGVSRLVTANYTNPSTSWYCRHGVEPMEDQWYKLEFAARPGSVNGSAGTGAMAWAAINGTEIAATYLANTPVGKEWHGVYYPFNTYANHTVSGAVEMLTGLELWEDWPSDASSHSVT